MPGFNANDYVSVAERVSQAQTVLEHVQADPPVMLTDTMGYIRVTVTLKEGRSATGTASFRLDLAGSRAQATNPLEDCETSAIGRALAFLGFASSKSIASREEVQEAERRSENGNGRRQAMIGKIQAMQVQAKKRKIEVRHKPIETATDEELIEIGTAYKAALEEGA